MPLPHLATRHITKSIMDGDLPLSRAAMVLVYYLVGALALLLVLLFLAFTAYLGYVHWKYAHLPQPKRPSFYFGHTPDIIRLQKESGNNEISVAVMAQQWSEQVGSLNFVTFFIHLPIVFVLDSESVKTVIMNPKHRKYPSFYMKMAYLMGERFMGKGIFTILDFDTWKPRRQLYDPAFKKSYLKTLLDPFNEIVNAFIEELRPTADGVETVLMKIKFGEFTLNVMSKVAFGTDFTQTLTETNVQLKSPTERKSLTSLVDFCFNGLDNSLRWPGYQYYHPLKAAEYRKVSRSIRAIGRDCIKKRIQMIESGERVPNDILTHILQLASTRESVDIEELVDDFVTFYIAGQETTSNLLSFALVLTLLHPNVHERVQSEVDDVLGDKTYVTAEDLEKLEYTEQVLKETLRMYSPVIGLVKEVASGGVALSGYHVPAQTQLILCTAAMCNMAENFDDPEMFNPSRFDPSNEQPSSFVYFPFGLGHRSCIGKHFAMMKAKIAFSRLFQTYRISLPENYEVVAVQRVMVQTEDDIPCRLNLRSS